MAMKFEDVEAIVAKLPDVELGTSWGNRTYAVGKKAFAWRRPFSKADLKRFGDETPPQGDILGVKVENLDEKDALLSMDLPGFFTIEHFNGYPAVLIELRKARAKDVRTALTEAHRIASATIKPKRAARTVAARRTKRKARTVRRARS
jgi:hypothetical protein